MRPAATDAADNHRATDETARLAARWAEERAPRSFRGRRVAISELAEDLGLVLRQRADMDAKARVRVYREATPSARLWEDGTPGELEINEIQVRSDLADSTRRFAIAHEIGHVVLRQQFAEVAARLPLAWQEVFANRFAAEVLVSFAFRDEIRKEFWGADQPTALVKLAHSLGVSPRTLLRFAISERGWFDDLDRVWLDIRHLPNRYTSRDPRLRVHSVFLDRGRWFLPPNRSVKGLLGNDQWLTHARAKAFVEQGWITISKRRLEPGRPRFVEKSLPARLSALKLRPGRGSVGAELLVSADLLVAEQPS
jgi:hypothetical protein